MVAHAYNTSPIFFFLLLLIFTPFSVRPQVLSHAEHTEKGLIYLFTKYDSFTTHCSFLLLTHSAIFEEFSGGKVSRKGRQAEKKKEKIQDLAEEQERR